MLPPHSYWSCLETVSALTARPEALPSATVSVQLLSLETRYSEVLSSETVCSINAQLTVYERQ